VDDCIFCRIARGELPARLVYENEQVIAFDDISPQAPVHVLIVPRTHHGSLGDGVDAELAAALLLAIPVVAEAAGVTRSGYRVIINTGPDSRQSVSHLHIHVLGGKPMSHRMLRFADEAETTR